MNILCRYSHITPDTILLCDMWIHPNFQNTYDVYGNKIDELFLKRVVTRIWRLHKEVAKIHVNNPSDVKLYKNLKFEEVGDNVLVRYRQLQKNG